MPININLKIDSFKLETLVLHLSGLLTDKIVGFILENNDIYKVYTIVNATT